MTPIPDTRSLRPQGFFAYAFLAARITSIPALATITGLISHSIVLTTQINSAQQPPAPSLLATVALVSPLSK
jgi:hypothetical protein